MSEQINPIIDQQKAPAPSHRFDDVTVQLFAEFDTANIIPDDLPDLEERALYKGWLGSLDENTRLILDERKQARVRHEVIKDVIVESAPYLLDGKLSSEQEERLGTVKYVLGINQSGTSSLSEAIDFLKEENGISLGIYGLDQRFLLIDINSVSEHHESGERAIVDGYYGSTGIGKFIVAIPMENRTKYVAQDANATYQDIEGFIQPTAQDGGRSVSPRYIAGYIDDKGKYSENKNFGLSAEPLFE
jgi:hypothetical protein